MEYQLLKNLYATNKDIENFKSKSYYKYRFSGSVIKLRNSTIYWIALKIILNKKTNSKNKEFENILPFNGHAV